MSHYLMSLNERFPEIKDWDHEKKYRFIVERIGLDHLYHLIPFDLETLRKSFEKDKHFNTELTPIKIWDRHIDIARPVLNHNIETLIGVNYISHSEICCILKTAAKMMIEEPVSPMKEENI